MRSGSHRRACRISSSETMPHYARYQPPLVVSISAPTAEGFASLAAELSLAGDRRDRGQHLVPEHRGGRQGIRDERRPPPRTSSGSCAPRPGCRSGSSSRPTPATCRRSPGGGSGGRRCARRGEHHPVDGNRPARRSSHASATSWAACPGRRSSRSCCGKSTNARAR